MVQELLATDEQMAALSDQVQHAYEKAEDERKTLERFIMQAPAKFAIVYQKKIKKFDFTKKNFIFANTVIKYNNSK